MKDVHIILLGIAIFIVVIVSFWYFKIFVPVWIYFIMIVFFLISIALLFFSGYLFSSNLSLEKSNALDVVEHIKAVFANRFEVLPFKLGNFVKYSEYYHEAKNKQYYGYVFETDPIRKEIVIIWNDTDKQFAYINFDPEVEELHDPFARFNPFKEIIRYRPPEKKIMHYHYKKFKKKDNLLDVGEGDESDEEE